MSGLPLPEPGAEAQWVGAHLGGLFMGAVAPSQRFRGGQAAADAALDAFAVPATARFGRPSISAMTMGLAGASGFGAGAGGVSNFALAEALATCCAAVVAGAGLR